MLNQGLRFYEICDYKMYLVKIHLHILLYFDVLYIIPSRKKAEWPIYTIMEFAFWIILKPLKLPFREIHVPTGTQILWLPKNEAEYLLLLSISLV